MKEQDVNFNTMTKQSAIRICKEFESDFKRSIYFRGEDGQKRFTELIEGLELDLIKPSELPSYGMKADFY